MASEDETIRIQVDSVEARAQLAALEKEVRELEAELKTLNSTAGVTNAEIEGTTRRLGEARAKFAEAGEEVQKFNDTQEEGGKKTQSLADKYVTLGLKVFGARQVLMAAGEAMRSVAQATGSYSGATKDAIDQTDNLLQSIASLDLIGASKALGQLAGQTVAWAEGLNEVNTELGNLADKNAADEFRKILEAQGKLVQGHKDEVAALDLKAAALEREIATQRASGEVQKFLRDQIQETLTAYEKAGEAVPAGLAAQAAALNIVSDAQAKAADSAKDLEEAGTKAADARAKAEQKAADEIVAALEKERAALDAKLAQDEARLAKALGAGGKIDTSGDADAAKKDLAALQAEIKQLESQPLLDSDELNKLNTLKDRAGAAASAARDLGEVFTQTADDFLTEGEAANAAGDAWAVYGDRLQIAQRRHEDAIRSLDEADASLQDFTDTADEAASSATDVGDAAASIGDGAKKGTDKASEGLGKMKDGLTEAIPLAEQLRGILQEIVTLGSQADI